MNCGSLTVIHGLWLFLKLGRVSLRIVPSGRTMVFVAFRLLTLLGHSLGLSWFHRYAITYVSIEKDWFDGYLQHLCKLIWFFI